MCDQWFKSSHMHFWAPPSLSRQWLVRIVNHTLLLIRGVSRFSTNIRSVNQVLTDALWAPPIHCRQRPPSLSWQWLVRVVNHILILVQGVQGFSTNASWASSKNCHAQTPEHHRVFLGSDSCKQQITHYSSYEMCHDSLQIRHQWVKSSQTHFWAPPSLSRYDSCA